MSEQTVGIVVSVKKQWWLKINTKAFRKSAWDGAIFPHVIKVKYLVDGKEFFKRKWISAVLTPPALNSEVLVFYNENKPKKSKIIIK